MNNLYTYFIDEQCSCHIPIFYQTHENKLSILKSKFGSSIITFVVIFFSHNFDFCLKR